MFTADLGQIVNDAAMHAFEPDEVGLGGGNVKRLKDLPQGWRAGDEASAFRGGFRLWEPAQTRPPRGGARPATAEHATASDGEGSDA